MSTEVIFLLFLVVSSFVNTLQSDKLQERDIHDVVMRQDAGVLRNSRVSKRSLARRVRRAATGDSLCQSQEETFQTKLAQDTKNEFVQFVSI